MARSTSEVLITNAAGGTDLLRTASAQSPRRFLAISNHGPNPIFVTIGGEIPVVGRGLRVNATSMIVLELDAVADLRAIAATAAQVAGAGTSTSEW